MRTWTLKLADEYYRAVIIQCFKEVRVSTIKKNKNLKGLNKEIEDKNENFRV